MKLLLAVLTTILLSSNDVTAQLPSSQLEYIVQRYTLLHQRGDQIWEVARSTSPSNQSTSLAIRREILDFARQAFDYSQDIHELAIVQRETGAVPDPRLMLMVRSLQAMIDTINAGSDYLTENSDVYLRAARGHEAAWRELHTAAAASGVDRQ